MGCRWKRAAALSPPGRRAAAAMVVDEESSRRRTAATMAEVAAELALCAAIVGYCRAVWVWLFLDVCVALCFAAVCMGPFIVRDAGQWPSDSSNY